MNKPNLKKFKKTEWIKIYSGFWSMLSNCYLGYEHSKLVKHNMGHGPSRVIIISHQGRCACHYDKADLAKFGKGLAKLVQKDQKLLPRWCEIVKKASDDLIVFIKKQPSNFDVLKKGYGQFLKMFHDFPVHYVPIKQTPNFLPPDLFKKYIPLCDETRLYTENLYTETENYMRKFAKAIGKKTGYEVDLVLSCTDKEFDKFLKIGKLPQKTVLKERFNFNGLIFKNGALSLVTGKKAKQLEQIMIGSLKIAEVKGTTAHPGLVKGKVRIVFNPNKADLFNKGDILVTGMTRPEFLHLMKKSGAVVTDAGGVLCHAAITARELKIPTVIGTEKATKVFKDGDLVEVDANKGIVRKI